MGWLALTNFPGILSKFCLRKIVCPIKCSLAFSSNAKWISEMNARSRRRLCPGRITNKIINLYSVLDKEGKAEVLAALEEGTSSSRRQHREGVSESLKYLLEQKVSPFDLFFEEKEHLFEGDYETKREHCLDLWENMLPEEQQDYVDMALTHKEIIEERQHHLATAQLSLLAHLDELHDKARFRRRVELKLLSENYRRPEESVSSPFWAFWNSLPDEQKDSVKAAALWRNLSDAQKQFRTAYEKYKVDLLKWENRMIGEGHEDVVKSFHELDYEKHLLKDQDEP